MQISENADQFDNKKRPLCDGLFFRCREGAALRARNCAAVWIDVVCGACFPAGRWPSRSGESLGQRSGRRVRPARRREELEERLLGILHEIVFLTGKVWQSLVEFIREKEMDLVVFSTRGRSGFDKPQFGSVATDIFWNAPCPALIVGPAVSAKLGENAALNRILYATDFTTESLAAVPQTISLARQHRAQAILLHAIQGGEDVPAMLYSLRQLIPLGAELPQQPECLVERGESTSKIVEVADRHQVDLIILGIGAIQSPLRKHFSQSGIFKIITEAKCPVLTVRA